MPPTIDDLKNGSAEEEYKIAIFFARLLNGIDIDGNWIRLEKLNSQEYKDDPSLYEVDFGFKNNGEIIGYLDIERKTKWFDEWKCWQVNIPLYPMSHWERGRFNGNHTVKLQRFSTLPRYSFWVGARNDYMAYIVIPFRTMIEHGKETTQKTGYDKTPLPVIAIPNKYCEFFDNEEDLINYFIAEFKAWQT